MKNRATTPAEEKDDIIELLISDIDFCLETPGFKTNDTDEISHRPDSLSQVVIDHAKSRPYKGFYLCTHRYYEETFNMTLAKDRLDAYDHYQGETFHPLNNFIGSVRENFSKATGLPFIAASTADDICLSGKSHADRCGYVYEHFTKAYEEELIKTNKTLLDARALSGYHNLRMAEEPKRLTHFNKYSKNAQLLSAIHHALRFFPGKKIRFTYVDDVRELCESARDFFRSNLPEGVASFEVYHYNPYECTALTLLWQTERASKVAGGLESTANVYKKLKIDAQPVAVSDIPSNAVATSNVIMQDISSSATAVVVNTPTFHPEPLSEAPKAPASNINNLACRI